MTVLTPSARAVIESDHPAHLVTLNPDGSPHVTLAWVGLDGDEIVIASLRHFRKLRNIELDPRVSVSMLGLGLHPIGLREYLVVYGTARMRGGRRRRAAAPAGAGVHRPGHDVPARRGSAARVDHADHSGPVGRSGTVDARRVVVAGGEQWWTPVHARGMSRA